MTIVVVESDAEELKRASASVCAAFPGANVLPFIDPLLAFQHIFNNPVDIVLTAASMKRLDGFMLLKMIRQSEPGPAVYLLHKDDAFLRDAERLMADGYLTLPLTETGLHKALRRSE